MYKVSQKYTLDCEYLSTLIKKLKKLLFLITQMYIRKHYIAEVRSDIVKNFLKLTFSSAS